VRITKVVVFFTTNPRKLVLQFSEFSTIFYTFYKFLQICNTIEDVLLHRDPQKDLKSLQPGPQFADKPLERNRTSQIGPWPRGTAGSPEFRRLRPRSWAGSGSGSSRGSPRTYWWLGLGQGCPRHGSSTAAGGGGRDGAVSGE
jgi:hypothetical protein